MKKIKENNSNEKELELEQIIRHYLPMQDILPASKKHMFCLKLSELYLLLDNTRKSVQWLLPLTQSSRISIGILTSAKYIEIDLLHGKEEQDLMENKIRSLYRFLEKSQRLSSTHQIMLRFFGMILQNKFHRIEKRP